MSSAYRDPIVIAQGDANTATIKLSYHENHYPDDGDFTLVYGLSQAKREFGNRAPPQLWYQLRDILDACITNDQLKERWRQMHRVGCCGASHGCCFSANCCRFCCCNGACHACRSCISDRDYYVGGVLLIIFGCLMFGAIYSPGPILAIVLITSGSIMIASYNKGNQLKAQWREDLIALLVQNLGGISNQFNIRFGIERYPTCNLVLRLTFLNAAPVQQTQMIYVQQTQQTIQPVQVQPVQYVQPATNSGKVGYAPVSQAPAAYVSQDGGGNQGAGEGHSVTMQ